MSFYFPRSTLVANRPDNGLRLSNQISDMLLPRQILLGIAAMPIISVALPGWTPGTCCASVHPIAGLASDRRRQEASNFWVSAEGPKRDLWVLGRLLLHDHGGTDPDAIVEVDDIVVGQPETT